MWTHKLLNCPQPPQKLLDLALTMDPEQWGPISKTNSYGKGKDPNDGRRAIKHGKEMRYIRMRRYDMPQEFKDWIHANISDKCFEASIVMSDVGLGGGLGPHTDRSRDYSLMYIIKTGGPDVRTYFWQQQNQELIRNRFTFLTSYDDLELFDTADFVEGQWFLMNNRILHSVEHIQDRRLVFQISIDKDISDIDKFCVTTL